MNDIFTASLADITPPNIASDPEISRIITALDPVMQKLSRDAITPAIIPRINSAPVISLDALAVQFHADLFGLASSDSDKRSVINESLLWHMRKGTPSAIIDALKHAGVTAKFIPWWKFGGRPYTFRIEAEITGDFYRTLARGKIISVITTIINDAKAARSLLDYLDTRLNFSELTQIYSGIIPHISGEITLRPLKPSSPDSNAICHAQIIAKSGQLIHNIHRERAIITTVSTGNISFEAWSVDLGVDLKLMQELLFQFESRIFTRIASLEAAINAKIDAQYSSLDAKIDSVIEMLRWKGEDEEL